MTWLISKALCASLRFLPEQAVGSSAAFYVAGEQSAQSKSSPTRKKFSSPDKTTAVSTHSRFGTTYARLTAAHGEAVLTSLLAASPAKTSASQAEGRVSLAQGQACGQSTSGSFAKYDPATHSWKTPQRSLLADSIPYSPILPKQGTMRHGILSQPPMSALHICANASGFCVSCAKTRQLRAQHDTPTTMDSLPPKSATALIREATQARPGRSRPANLRDQISNTHLWPTPTVCGNHNRKGLSKTSGDGLATAVAAQTIYATPSASDCTRGGTITPAKTGTSLTQQINTLARLQTPTTRDRFNPSEMRRKTPSLAVQAGGRLNPDWVERLMGWPPGWTALIPIKDPTIPQGWPANWDQGIPRTQANAPHTTPRIKAIGNGQVPQAAAAAFEHLKNLLKQTP
jgi:hypothetical protein